MIILNHDNTVQNDPGNSHKVTQNTNIFYLGLRKSLANYISDESKTYHSDDMGHYETKMQHGVLMACMTKARVAYRFWVIDHFLSIVIWFFVLIFRDPSHKGRKLKQWSLADVAKGVELLKQGVSTRKASYACGIPKNTLLRRYHVEQNSKWFLSS